MKRYRVMFILILILFPGIIVSQENVFSSVESDPWREQFLEQFQQRIQNQYISAVTLRIIEENITEEIILHNPEDVAVIMSELAINIEIQLRKGVSPERLQLLVKQMLSRNRGNGNTFVLNSNRAGAPGSMGINENQNKKDFDISKKRNNNH